MKHRRNFLVAMAFIAPALLIYVLYFIAPIPTSFYYSLFQWNGLPSQYKITTPILKQLEQKSNFPAELIKKLSLLRNKKFEKETEFWAAVEQTLGKEASAHRQQLIEAAYSGKKYIGFGNWTALARDPIFWKALINNVILVVASILLQIPAGIILGVFISSTLRGTRLFKLIYFIPMMISSVAIGITWMYVYQPNFGLLNSFLRLIGFDRLAAIGWLGEPKLALGSVIVATCWQFIPFYMILFAAALSGIPKDIYEAASIDGATGVQAFFQMTLPLLKGSIRVACVLSLTGSLRFFDLLFVMTGGGPNHASELLATYMFKQAFTSFNMGYGSTIAVFMLLLSFVLAVATLSSGKKDDGIYA